MTEALGELSRIPRATTSLAGIELRDDLVLRRAWPKGPGRLTLEYTCGGEVVAAQAARDPGDLARTVARTRGAGLVAIGGHVLLVQPRGADRRLPLLARDAEVPGARLLAHRAERRATVASQGKFTKYLPPGTVTSVAALHRAVTAVPVPAVLEVDDAGGRFVLGAVPGVALHDLLRGGRAGEPELRAVGQALRVLHEQALPWELLDVAPHGPGTEARVLAGWLDRLEAHAPGIHAEAACLAVPVLRELEGVTTAPFVLLHRDLHDKQILLARDGSAGLIDLDTLTLGDPAVDLANLLAHLTLRRLQGLLSQAEAELRQGLLDGYDPSAAVASRIGLLERATLLRLACVYAFRPGWLTAPGAGAGARLLLDAARNSLGSDRPVALGRTSHG